MERETRNLPLTELRFAPGDDNRIEGRAIVFDSLSLDLGGFVERFLPGSVHLDPDLRILFDHDTSMVLGRVVAGTATAVIDEAGVSFSAEPPDTSWARDLRVSMQRGDIDQCSFSFSIDDGGDHIEFDTRLGKIVRTVTSATVYELSVVSMPAYPATSAMARERVAEIRSAVRQERAETFAASLEEADAQRMASWGRLWQLEYALEDTIASLASAGEERADDAIDEFSAAAKVWAVEFLATFGSWYRSHDDAETRAIARTLSTDIAPVGAAPSGCEGDAPSEAPGLVFFPGIGFRTVTKG